MRQGDGIVLAALRHSSADWCSAAEWDAIERVVAEAGGVELVTGYAREVIEKAAKQFGSRSEAGRYAAQVRWGRRGSAVGGGDGASADLQARVDALAAKSIAAATKDPVDDYQTRPFAADKGDDNNTNEKQALAAAGLEDSWEGYYRLNRDKRGWGGPAQSATAEEVEALVATGQFVVTYRGGRTSSHEKYLTDNANIGGGAMGNGMYTSPTRARAAAYDNAEGKEVRAYLVPVAGLMGERMDSTDTWQRPTGLHAVRLGINASYGQSGKVSGTDDLLIHNIGMLIQAPKGWKMPDQTFSGNHPMVEARRRGAVVDLD